MRMRHKKQIAVALVLAPLLAGFAMRAPGLGGVHSRMARIAESSGGRAVRVPPSWRRACRHVAPGSRLAGISHGSKPGFEIPAR